PSLCRKNTDISPVPVFTIARSRVPSPLKSTVRTAADWFWAARTGGLAMACVAGEVRSSSISTVKGAVTLRPDDLGKLTCSKPPLIHPRTRPSQTTNETSRLARRQEAAETSQVRVTLY